MLLDDLVFRLQHFKSDSWDAGDHFVFYKTKELIDQYAAFFDRCPHFHPRNVLELGIWDGGSIAFWYGLFNPQKHIAIDITPRPDSSYFDRYVASNGLSKRIRTHWDTDQADQAKLTAIAAGEFDGPLDLVIDDASHLYRPTLKSFEALFPRVRSGGLYIIEDWAWGHWPDFFDPKHAWADQEPLTRLVVELIEATGTSVGLIANVTVYQGFIAIERGPWPFEALASAFVLSDHIKRRPQN